MSKILKNLYDNLSEPVLVFDKKNNTVSENKAFLKVFGSVNKEDFEHSLKKIENRFYFDVCVLDSDNITNYAPITNAIKSKYNWGCYCIWEKNEKESLHYVIKTVNLKNLKVVYFYDVTDKILFRNIEEENKKLKIQNQEFVSANTKAQNQAVKMALLNRIGNTLRETTDTKNLIETALNELCIMFGAKRLYFLNEVFEVEYVYPKNLKKENIKLQNDLYDRLLKDEIIVERELDENKVLNTKVLMPVVNRNSLIGVFVIYTSQNNVGNSEIELLKSISMQVASAILTTKLFKQINNKNEELEKALKELKETQLQLINSEKMASLGQLIASVAHEINTPLASISSNNEIMKKVCEKYQNSMLDELNGIDREAIKRITNIVKSLKRFVRLDEEERQSANINEELDLTLTLLRQKTKNNIEVVKDYGDIPNISCYPNMLNQVFLNILMNGIQAVEACKKTGKIVIKTRCVENNLKIEISDDGEGIDEKDYKKIFHAGFTTKKVGEGTGLGLAICKKIIDEHKGTIDFESKKNVGTTFKIVLPIC